MSRKCLLSLSLFLFWVGLRAFASPDCATPLSVKGNAATVADYEAALGQGADLFLFVRDVPAAQASLRDLLLAQVNAISDRQANVRLQSLAGTTIQVPAALLNSPLSTGMLKSGILRRVLARFKPIVRLNTVEAKLEISKLEFEIDTDRASELASTRGWPQAALAYVTVSIERAELRARNTEIELARSPLLRARLNEVTLAPTSPLSARIPILVGFDAGGRLHIEAPDEVAPSRAGVSVRLGQWAWPAPRLQLKRTDQGSTSPDLSEFARAEDPLASVRAALTQHLNSELEALGRELSASSIRPVFIGASPSQLGAAFQLTVSPQARQLPAPRPRNLVSEAAFGSEKFDVAVGLNSELFSALAYSLFKEGRLSNIRLGQGRVSVVQEPPRIEIIPPPPGAPLDSVYLQVRAHVHPEGFSRLQHLAANRTFALNLAATVEVRPAPRNRGLLVSIHSVETDGVLFNEQSLRLFPRIWAMLPGTGIPKAIGEVVILNTINEAVREQQPLPVWVPWPAQLRPFIESLRIAGLKIVNNHPIILLKIDSP